MKNSNYDVYESFANEHNARILKASTDARLLRSLSEKNETEPEVPVIHMRRSRLMSILAALIKVLKHQPA